MSQTNAENRKPVPFFVNEQWSKFSTRVIFNTLPPALQTPFIQVINSYKNGGNTAAWVSEWGIPAPRDMLQEPVLMVLPTEFTKGPNFLAEAIARWGIFDSASNLSEEGFQKGTVLLSSLDDQHKPVVRQVIARIPQVADGRIFLPLRYNRLSTVGCGILVAGAVDAEAYQFVLKEPQSALNLLGGETYGHYLKRFDKEWEEKKAKMHAVLEGSSVVKQDLGDANVPASLPERVQTTRAIY